MKHEFAKMLNKAMKYDKCYKYVKISYHDILTNGNNVLGDDC